MPSHILGLSAYYHDSAACLLRDGEIVAAAQEERFTRKKGDAAFPQQAVAYCLEPAGSTAEDLTHVGFYDKPLLKFERILETYLGIAPKGFRSFLMAGPLWIKDKLYLDKQLRDELGYEGEIFYAEHHESHAASAFFPSPFEEAAILTMDGVGEWATASIGVGEGNDIRLLSELHWPDSLGLLYSAITYYLGFKVNSGEYKVMGLAPYGEPKYVKLLLDNVVNLREDGSLTLNQKYFDYLGGLTMTNAAFDELFGGAAAGAGDPPGPARPRHRPLGPGGLRGGDAPDGAHRPPADRHGPALPRRWRRAQLRRQRPHPPRGTRSSGSGSSPPRATPAARSVWPSSSGTGSSRGRGRSTRTTR